MTGRMKLTAIGLALAGILPLAAHADSGMAGMHHMEGMSTMPGMSAMPGMSGGTSMDSKQAPANTGPAEDAHAHHSGGVPANAANGAAMNGSMGDNAGHSMNQQMNGGTMPTGRGAAMQRMPMTKPDHSAMSMSAMPGMPGAMAMPSSQGNASAQQSSETAASATPRDPNAYSDGYTLGSGPYALPGGRQLHLADKDYFGTLLIDRLERGFGRDTNSNAYDVKGWFGRDYNRLALKAEGDIAGGKLQDSRAELLWSHAIANYWDTQLGVRADSGGGNGRGWVAAGIEGLAPYWFDVEATAYAGDGGRTALRLGAEYEVLLTQRLILQPRAELNLYGKRDLARGIGSGLSDAVAGVRLRYEFSRQFAPYVGAEWSGKFGETADFSRADGERTSDLRAVVGVKMWF